MRTLVCFLEEPSAREMLKGVLPRLLPADVEFQYVVFKGKQDMEKELERKLRSWNKPNSVFLVMRDQDSADCKDVKRKLLDLCKKAKRPEALVRIACHELESFYFGDLSAVEKGLDIKSVAKKAGTKKYRDPDSIVNPSDELDSLTKGIYQKISGSRAIAPHLSLENNASKSFNILISGIYKIIEE